MKNYIITAILLLLLIPMVSALDTDVTVTTGIPEQDIIIQVLDYDTGAKLERITKTTDIEGETTFSFIKDLMRIKFKIMGLENGIVAETKEIDKDFITGGAILLDFKNPDNSKMIEDNVVVEAPEEETTEEETEGTTTEEETVEEITTEEETEETTTGQAVTGSAVAKTKEFILKSKYYIFELVALIILVFVILTIYKHRKTLSKEFKKAGDIKIIKPGGVFGGGTAGQLADAEKKLAQAQKEIMDIKNQGKIAEAQKKLEADKAELEKLRGS